MKRNEWTITQEVFDTLPEDVKAKIKDTLRAFDSVEVVYEFGEYHVNTFSCLKASYGSDHKVIGTAYQDDFYSIDDYKKIYQEEFGYPYYCDPNYYKKRKEAEIGKVFIC